jgi:hypothetical protein
VEDDDDVDDVSDDGNGADGSWYMNRDLGSEGITKEMTGSPVSVTIRDWYF